jgi:hypothetical protein
MDDTGAEVIKAITAGEPASRHRAWSGVGELRGFEPPVHRRTLAFKLREATYGSSRGTRYRWSRLGTCVTRTVVNRHE